MTRKVYLDNDTFDICKLTFDCKFLKQIFKKFLFMHDFIAVSNCAHFYCI